MLILSMLFEAFNHRAGVTIKRVTAADPVVGLRGLKSSEQHGVEQAPSRSFDSAPQALRHAINLLGAPLRMTILWVI